MPEMRDVRTRIAQTPASKSVCIERVICRAHEVHPSSGEAFNAQGGGVWATLFTKDEISIWFWAVSSTSCIPRIDKSCQEAGADIPGCRGRATPSLTTSTRPISLPGEILPRLGPAARVIFRPTLRTKPWYSVRRVCVIQSTNVGLTALSVMIALDLT